VSEPQPPAGSETDSIDAPIVAVTVYPDRARVTRRGTVTLPAGEHRVAVGGLPKTLERESVRVSGRATGGTATVLGVDVVQQRRARADEPAVAALVERRLALRAQIAELEDTAEIEQSRAALLDSLSRRSGAAFAKALASGRADAGQVASLGDALAEQHAAIKARRRELVERRQRLEEEIAAVGRELSERGEQNRPDRRAAVLTLAVGEGAGATVDVEVSYVVPGAGWRPYYDARLTGDRLEVTWYGLVTQQTDEDWPECDLRLSTARPTVTSTVPELDPWYLDRYRPPQLVTRGRMRAAMDMPAQAAPAAPGAAGGAFGAAETEAAPVATATATVEQGAAAATYRPQRPVAVPADGSAHRVSIAVLDLAGKLDYVTVPKISLEAYLRVTVVNTSPHTLLPGRTSVFHEADFVGTTRLETWAPGEEVELSLGVDDRLRVERELTRRHTSKIVLGGGRRTDFGYEVTVANHTGRPARVSIVDQLPVSRDEAITVKDTKLTPEPAERTDIGEVTWKLELAPGAEQKVTTAFRVESQRNVEIVGL
jgi:uncharacterized protein (TIGR02231 family)